MATQPNAPEVLLAKLGFEPTSLVRGLQAARDAVAKFKAEATLKFEEFRRARAQFESQFSISHRSELEKRLRDLSAELATATGKHKQAIIDQISAVRAQLSAFDAQIKKVRELKNEYDALKNNAQKAQASVGLLAQKSPGAPFFLNRIVGGFTLGGAAQALGIGAAAASLPLLLRSVGEGFVNAAVSAGKYADEIEEASQKTGIAAPQLHAFVAIGKTVGVGLEDMTTAVRSFSRAITGGGGGDDLESAATKGAKVLAALGIETRDKTTGAFRAVNEVLLDVADRFERLPNGALKSRAALELFGRAGLNLLPFLSLGRQGVQELLGIIDSFGPSFSRAGNLFNQLELAQAKFDLSLLVLKTRISEEVLPTITDLVGRLSTLLTVFREMGAAEALKFAVSGFTAPSLGALARQFGIQGAVEFADEARKRLFFELSEAIQAAQKRGLGPQAFPLSAEARRILERAQSADVRKLFPKADEIGRVFQVFLNEGLVSIGEVTEEQKKLTAESERYLVQLEKIFATAKKGRELEDTLRRQRQELADIREERQKILAETGIRAAEGPEWLRLIQQRLAAVGGEALLGLPGIFQGALSDAESQARILERLAQQAGKDQELIQRIQQDRIEIERRINTLLRERGELEREEIETLRHLVQEAGQIPIKLSAAAKIEIVPALEPDSAAAARSAEAFKAEFERILAERRAGVIQPEQEITAIREIQARLQQEMQVRLLNLDISKRGTQEFQDQIKALEKLNDLAKQLGNELGAASKETGFGRLLSTFQRFSDIIARFSGGLRRSFSEIFAGIEGIVAAVDALRVLGGGTRTTGGQVIGGSALRGLGSIFGRGGGDIFKRLSGLLSLVGGLFSAGGIFAQLLGGGFRGPGRGALTGAAIGTLGTAGILLGAGAPLSLSGLLAAAGATGPLAPIVIGFGALFGGLAGAKRKRTRKIAKEIQDEFKGTLQALNEGSQGIAKTIAELERQRADAIRRLSGRKGGQKELQPILDEIDKSLVELRRRQKEILDRFSQQVGLLRVPEAARDAAEAIQQIARTLKEAADAGATAQQQIEFLNRSLDELKTKLGRELRDEEQETLDLLLQQIDLQKQRADIEKQFAERERQIRGQFGLERALTPAQQAAVELKALREQRDLQLKALDEQQANLRAQLEGRAELFGFSLKDLDATGARERIIERILALERSVTQEIIARINAQQAFFADLSAGVIPQLPAGLLPTGFAFPQGAQYIVQNPTFQIIVTRNIQDERELARMLKGALRMIGDAKYLGAEVL